jgi:hypothetical protein
VTFRQQIATGWIDVVGVFYRRSQAIEASGATAGTISPAAHLRKSRSASEGEMIRLVFLLAALSMLGGALVGAEGRKALRRETLPPSLGYADVISEGVAQN